MLLTESGLKIDLHIPSDKIFRIGLSPTDWLYGSCVKYLMGDYYDKFSVNLDRNLIECPSVNQEHCLLKQNGELAESIEDIVYVKCFSDSSSYRNIASDRTVEHEFWELDQLELQLDIRQQSILLDGAIRLGEVGRQKEINLVLKELNEKLIELKQAGPPRS